LAGSGDELNEGNRIQVNPGKSMEIQARQWKMARLFPGHASSTSPGRLDGIWKNLPVWAIPTKSDQIQPVLLRRGIVAIGHGGSGTGLSRERAWVIPQSRDEGRMHFAVAGNPHRGAQTGSRPEPQTGGRPAAMSVVVDAWMSVVLFYGEAHAVLIANVEKKSAFARGFGVIALPILAADRLADWESADLPRPKDRFAGFSA